MRLRLCFVCNHDTEDRFRHDIRAATGEVGSQSAVPSSPCALYGVRCFSSSPSNYLADVFLVFLTALLFCAAWWQHMNLWIKC